MHLSIEGSEWCNFILGATSRIWETAKYRPVKRGGMSELQVLNETNIWTVKDVLTGKWQTRQIREIREQQEVQTDERDILVNNDWLVNEEVLVATGSLSRTRDLIILLAFCVLSDPLIQNDTSAGILHVSYKIKLCQKPHRRSVIMLYVIGFGGPRRRVLRHQLRSPR